MSLERSSRTVNKKLQHCCTVVPKWLLSVDTKRFLIVAVLLLRSVATVASVVVDVVRNEQHPGTTDDDNSQLHSTDTRQQHHNWWNHGRTIYTRTPGPGRRQRLKRSNNNIGQQHATTLSSPPEEEFQDTDWDKRWSFQDPHSHRLSDSWQNHLAAPVPDGETENSVREVQFIDGRTRSRWKKRMSGEDRPDPWQLHPVPEEKMYLVVDDPLPNVARSFVPLSETYPLLQDETVALKGSGSNLSVPYPSSTGQPADDRGKGSCSEMLCMAGASCFFEVSSGRSKCRCLLGTSGLFCEKDLVIKYPRFSGSSFIAFPVLRGAHREFVITIEFRPHSPDGVLLFSADHPSARFDFFSISIINSRLEFRFDCGSGMAVIRSSNFVVLDRWNNATIHRNEWNAWLRLNHGVQSRGKAKGQFSRINFREDLYLGGYFNLSRVGDRTGTGEGFIGCVRRLEINEHLYDMRKGAFVGDAIRGVDIEDCSDDVCRNVSCENGGLCIADNADIATCQCPLGTFGDRCQSRVQVRVPMFSGQSFLQYPGLQRNTLSFTEIEVVLKPIDGNGLILYNGFSRDRTGDFIDLVLRDGFVEYRFDLGTGPAVIRSREPIAMGEWHSVRLSRTGRNGFLKVDDQPLVEGMASGAFTQLTLTLDLFIGGHRNYDEVAKAAQVSRSFIGCIQKVVVNKRLMKLMEDAITGLNVNNCDHPCVGQPCLNGGRCQPMHDRYKCSCPLRFTNTNCEHKIYGDISAPRFMGDSYLLYTNPYLSQKTRGRTIELRMRVRPRGPNGLLFWVSEEETGPHGDYLAVGLKNGFVQLRYDLGSGEALILANQSRLDDDLWHTIKVKRFEKTASLEVDDNEVVTGTSPGSMKQLTTHGTIFLGGMDDVVHGTLRRFSSGFVGCMSNVTLGPDYFLDLVSSADDGSNISSCFENSNIISRRTVR